MLHSERQIISEVALSYEQGRIPGHQLRTGGQGRKCTFSYFSTRSLRTNGRTDQPTNGRTDGQSLLQALPTVRTTEQAKCVTQFFKDGFDFMSMSYAVSLVDGALRRHRTQKIKRDMKSAHFRDTTGSRRQLTAAKFGRSNHFCEALSYLKFFTYSKNKKKIIWRLFM